MSPFWAAALCSSAAWLVVRAVYPGDAQTAGRLSGLKGPGLPRPPAARAYFSLHQLFVKLGARLPTRHHHIKSLLASAGLDAVEPAAVAGWQICGAVAGLVLGLAGGAAAVLAAPLFAFGGYRAPLVFLALRARARRDEVASALPDGIDLLAVCTQAGLNLSLSLGRVASNTPGLLGKELKRLVEEIDLGLPRTEALRAFAERNRVEEVDALVACLANADRFGTSVASSLETLSAEIRQARTRRAEEQARRAPVKILFPMVFLILPAFLVLTVLPVVLGTLRSIGF